MVSGRTADLARCGVEGALDVECLAYTLKLAQERGANMSCEVKPVEGLIAARQQNRCCPWDSCFIKPTVYTLCVMAARWRISMDTHSGYSWNAQSLIKNGLSCIQMHAVCLTVNTSKTVSSSDCSRFCV